MKSFKLYQIEKDIEMLSARHVIPALMKGEKPREIKKTIFHARDTVKLSFARCAIEINGGGEKKISTEQFRIFREVLDEDAMRV